MKTVKAHRTVCILRSNYIFLSATCSLIMLTIGEFTCFCDRRVLLGQPSTETRHLAVFGTLVCNGPSFPPWNTIIRDYTRPPNTADLGTDQEAAVFGNRRYGESLYKT